MMSLSNKIVIFLNILSVIKVSLLETVHFTNSPNKLLTAKNFTTYKVEVPGSDPITIIEANTPVINNPTNFNQNFNNNLNSKYSINRIRNKLTSNNNNDNNNDENVMDLKTSLSMTVTPDNYYHTNNGDNVEESVTNQQNYNNNDVPQYSTMKTVYSPELLKKFLKDYADKLSTNSNNLPQDKLEEIIKLKNKIQSQIDGNQDRVHVEETDDSDSEEVKDDNDNDDDENRRHSSGVEADDDTSDNNHLSERKSYHPNKYYSGPSGSGSGSNNYYGSNKHPYNKNEGWVTLDAVPWSTSKVSKWHSSANNKYPGQSPFDRPPRPFSSSGVNRPGRPGSSYYVDDNEDEYNNEDDYYGNHGQYENRPFNRPPTSFSSQSHHSSSNYPYDYYDNKNPPTDNFYHHSSHNIQTSHGPGPGHNSHGHSSHSLAGSSSYGGYAPDKPPRPWQPEIITDDSSPEFPSSYHQNYHQGSSQSHNRPNDFHYNNMKQKFQVGGHHRVPSTYPNSGVDGQWVLVSTTKGYQFPKRNGQRAMSFKTQNGMTSPSGVRYNNKLVEDFHSNYNTNGNINKGIITAESVNYDTSVKVNNNRPTMTTQQKGIKLSVLPLFVNDKNTNEPIPEGTVSLFRPPPTPPQEHEHHDDPYHGMIEVGPSTETIEESVAAAAHANEQNALASTTKKKKKKKNKNNYNIMRKQSDSTSTVLAAVGAGLVPATMAMLAPMVLGRKRRSLDTPDNNLPYQYQQ